MRKYYISYITIISILSLVCINNISALSYQSEVGIGFTFNPTLSISLGSSDLAISNLTPGTTGDSNSISVNVATNAAYGYTLSATVDNTNLTHTNETNTFSSIATNANLDSLDTDNTWGYSYKNNLAPNPTWSSYSGLATSTSKVLFNTDSNTNSSISFKIGAKASSTQASGTYTNTINFIAVSKPMPKTIEDVAYMQTFGELNPTDLESVKNSMAQEYTYVLKDKRDEQEYTVAKLKDNKIWMTKNLNLAGGTEITSGLSDIPEGYTLPTANGFLEGNRLPESSMVGFDNDNVSFVYNSRNSTDNCEASGCYSYYSWHAATAGSGITITTNNTNASYSICPKGWKLPTSGTKEPWGDYSDFYNMAIAYGANPDILNDNSSNMRFSFLSSTGPGTIVNLIATGRILNSVFDYDNWGRYWSSTSAGVYSYYLNFNNPRAVNIADPLYRRRGYPVRCLAR